MSYTATTACCASATPAPPVPIPPLRAGEIDGRFLDLSADLGAVGDYVRDISTVGIGIHRADGAASTIDDLRLAGSNWPNWLDPNGLVINVGFQAPAASAGVAYWVTLTVTETFQGRLYIRDLTMVVAAVLG